MKPILILICGLMLVGCGKKDAAVPSPENPTSQTAVDETMLLEEITIAADASYLARASAEKDPSNMVKALDYSRAAEKADAAKANAQAAGLDDLIIAGAEAEGHTNAAQFLETRLKKAENEQ